MPLSTYTTEEAAARAGVQPITIRKAIYRGKLRAQKAGRDWLIDAHEFERWLTKEPHRTATPRNVGHETLDK